MDNTKTDASNLAVNIAGRPDHMRLSELERFAEIGRLSAGLLHEIINPLTAARLWLEECGLESPHISHARNSIYLMQRYIDAARQQVRREGRRHSFCVRTELEQVSHILSALASRKRVSLHLEVPGTHQIYGDPVKFQQIVANLVRNAMDSYDGRYAAGPGDKPVRLRLKPGRRHLTIKVSDEGCGIPPDRLDKVFEPFYSTKESSGLGIGLAAVKRSVEDDFGGDIRVISAENEGTTFIIKLRLRPEGRHKVRA